MNNQAIKTIITILFLACSAQAIGFDTIELSRRNIEPDQEFKIEVQLDNPGPNHQVEFFIDDYLLSRQNIGSDSDDVDSSVWDWDINELNCGHHTASAVLKRGNVTVETARLNFTVGTLPDVSFDPEQPRSGKTVTISLTDPDTRGTISGVKVEVYDVTAGKKEKMTTDSFGRVTYRPGDHGEYRLEFIGKGYCGKRVFYARNKLIIDGPKPEDPVVGELVSIALPSSVGVKLLGEDGNVYLTAETKIGGGANFTVNDAGTYIIVIGELSSRYWGVNKTLIVSDKDVPRISFSPENPIIGEPVTIKVATGSSPIDLAVLTVTAPDNSFDAFTTSSSGSIVFNPTQIGRYSVIAEKERFKTVDQSFEAKNKLALDVKPAKPLVGEEVIFSVKNQQANPVGDVTLTFNTGESVVTDASGIYRSSFTQAGQLSVTASKTPTLYWQAAKNLTIYGTLTVTLTPAQLELGEEATIQVTDNAGNQVSAQLSATKPDGTKASVVGNKYVGDEPGVHVIVAELSGYESGDAELSVNPNPLDLVVIVDGEKIMVTLSSHGERVKDVNIKLSNPYVFEAVTDGAGVAFFDVRSAGEYVFEVNNKQTKKIYETKTQTERIIKIRNSLFLIIPLFFVIAFTAIALFIVYHLSQSKKTGKKKTKRGKGKKKSGETFEKSGGSRLSGV